MLLKVLYVIYCLVFITGLGMEIGHEHPKPWRNPSLKSSANPTVFYLITTSYLARITVYPTQQMHIYQNKHCVTPKIEETNRWQSAFALRGYCPFALVKIRLSNAFAKYCEKCN